MSNELDEQALANFRKYLQIPSVQPDINYDDCLNFLKSQAEEINLTYTTFTYVEKKPLVILTWKGTEPSLPSILLNSHMDVVPVYRELWTHDPFAADVDEQGNIYARGSQDMKCVAIQYLEAVRRLQKAGRTFRRTIHLCFVPDEETGGKEGMKIFVNTDDYRNLNVGFALDEGLASADERFLIYYAERPIWHARYTISGTEGHGSLLLSNTCGEKLRKFVDQVMDYRQTQVDRLNNDSSLLIGNVTTLNITMLDGGVEPNVVPPELSIVLDIRLAIDVDHKEFEELINSWIENAGGNFSISYFQKNDRVDPTILDDSNPYWVAMRSVLDALKLKYITTVFPGGTDSRYVREIGTPCIGFSPMNNTPVLLHANDEFLNKNVFFKGIKIYEILIPALADLN